MRGVPYAAQQSYHDYFGENNIECRFWGKVWLLKDVVLNFRSVSFFKIVIFNKLAAKNMSSLVLLSSFCILKFFLEPCDKFLHFPKMSEVTGFLRTWGGGGLLFLHQ